MKTLPVYFFLFVCIFIYYFYFIKEQGWIDQLTRAIFLEFTIYNPNVNLFASVTLLVEFLPTGSAATYYSINVIQLYTFLGSFGILVLIFQIVFIFCLIYFIFTEIQKLRKQKCEYFKQFWNLNEFLIIVFSILGIVSFAIRSTATVLAIKTVFESELGEFVDFNFISMWGETYACICSAVAFCSTLKFLKLLRFNKKIGMLAHTLRYAFKDLVGFSCIFFIFFFAFALVGLIFFGSHVKGYYTIWSSFATLFKFVLGQFDLKAMQNANYIMGSAFFMTFNWIVIMGLMTMFVTILNEAFAQVKRDTEAMRNEIEIVDFMFEKIKSLKDRSKLKKIQKKNNKIRTDLDEEASTLSLRVKVRECDENDTTTGSMFLARHHHHQKQNKNLNLTNENVKSASSFKSLSIGHVTGSASSYAYDNDSLSLY
jgi:polycystin 1L2